jgi:predicted DNA-binding transcriptional regulator YafY
VPDEGYFKRLKQRVERELGLEDSTSTPTTFEDRLREKVRKFLRLDEPSAAPSSEPPAAPPPYYGKPRSLEEIKARLQAAGSRRPPVLVRMYYRAEDAPSASWRDVEPYSYRYRAKEDPHVPLLYGYCHKDQQLEAFKLQRIEDLQVTNTPFQPRWRVEFGAAT